VGVQLNIRVRRKSEGRTFGKESAASDLRSDLCRPNCRMKIKITKIKITSERRSAILTLSLWETPELCDGTGRDSDEAVGQSADEPSDSPLRPDRGPYRRTAPASPTGSVFNSKSGYAASQKGGMFGKESVASDLRHFT
jgi:hypothetical protein